MTPGPETGIPVSADARRVRCPSCGAQCGFDCVEMVSRALMIHVHVSRQTAADRLYGTDD